MTRVMVDSTNVADDPLTAQLVGYYVDGIYATTAAKVRQRFPNAVLVPISAIGSNAGIVGDVEPGCMTPTEAINWVLMRRAAGVDPSLYVNETYGWSGIRLAFAGAGVPQPHWWVANYDGIAVIPPGAVAKQYANPTLTHGHFDLSVVADYWPGVDATYGASATQLSRHSAPRRVIAIATINGLHQFCRGRADATTGHRQLYHRRRLAGTWSAWLAIGGDGNLGVDDLGTENIAVGVDDLDVIVVTVTGSDGASFFETTSKDNGANWTPWAGPFGAGDGLVALSAAPATPPAPVVTSATLTGELTAPITVTLKS